MARQSILNFALLARKTWQYSLVVATLGSPSLAQQEPANLVAARSAMSDGLNAMKQRSLDEARTDFERVVKLAPQVELGHAALGSVLLALNQLDASIKELETAHQMAPGDLDVDLNLGRAQVGLGRYEAAIASFRECLSAPQPLALSPDETLAYATALSATHQVPAALDMLVAAVAQNPDSAQLSDGLGTLLAQSGKLEAALPHFEHAVATDPSLPTAQLHLSVALLALSRPTDAIGPATAAATAMPASFDTQLQLGRALSAIHRDSEALIHLHRATELASQTQSPDALYNLALALQASGDAHASLPVFAAVMAAAGWGASGTRGAALTNYALAKVQTGDAPGALTIYAQALAAGPDSATLREDYGAAYLQKADLDDAVTQFKAGLTIEPGSAHLHYDLGLAYKLKDDLASAIPEFEQAAALDATLPDPVFTLGVIYMQQGKFPEAIANLRKATALEPTNGDAWALLGSVLKDSGDAVSAADALHHAIDLQPDQPSLHIQLATLDSQAGRTADAASERKIAADLSRAAMSHQRADFALKSGRTLLEQNKLSEAVFQLNTAITADPTLPEPHRLLAEAYTRQGKAVEAALEEKLAAKLSSSPKAP